MSTEWKSPDTAEPKEPILAKTDAVQEAKVSEPVYYSTLDEEAAKVRWENLVEEAVVLSPKERSVIDAAVSIAEDVLGVAIAPEIKKPKEAQVETAKTAPVQKASIHKKEMQEASLKEAHQKNLQESIPQTAQIEKPKQGIVEEKQTIIPQEKEVQPVRAEVTGDIQTEIKSVQKAATREERLTEANPMPVQDSLKMGDVFKEGLDDDLFAEPVKMVIDEALLPKKKKRGIRVLFGTIGVLCVLMLMGAFVLNMFLDRLNYEFPLTVTGGTSTVLANGSIDVALVLKNEGIRKEDAMVPVDYDGEDMLHFLLIGEEAMEEEALGMNGRSDTMIVASINLKNHTLKLTSFMRDLYVDIPGYGKNRLNAAYSFGGSELVAQTLNENFGVYIDGYIKVNFDGFKKLINKIGGVDITLTAAEAEYLNTTNYISGKKNRNVVEGAQTLNGAQALGYARIRKVAGIKEIDDFGRTARQRMVLSSAYKKIKEMNLFDVLTMAYEVLPYVTTNISKGDIINYAKLALSIDLTEVESSRIPIDNGFTFARLRIGNTLASVLMPNMEVNRQALYDYLYDGQIPETMPSAAPASATPAAATAG